ncbi:MAG: NfeD family protein [Ruminococcus sp.]|nr:NfeD family protein [Ruminococcus sp.]
MTQTAMIVGWAMAFVFFTICEIATSTALVSIWLALSSLIAMFFAIGNCSFTIQLLIFVVSSIVLLILTRPFVKKMQTKTVHTNFELDIGKTAVVTEDINNDYSVGRVKLNGVNWEARSDDGTLISAGSIVTVKEISGSKLIVSK